MEREAGVSEAIKEQTQRRSRNAPGEGGRLRDELIAAASHLLADTNAVDALSLRAVAREVGIAAPSVYLHFPSREALLRAVLEEHFAALKQAIEDASAEVSGPAAGLRAGCLAYCRFALEQPGPYRVLFGISRQEPDAPPSEQLTGMDAFATLVDGIGACMVAGVAPVGDPFAVATAVWAALHGTVSLRQAMLDFPWPPLETQVDEILAGLARVSLEPI